MILKLPKPLPTQFIVGQNFGENNACIYPDNRVVGKTAGVCPVGSEDLYKKFGMSGHNGLDLPAPKGTPIYSCTEGVVREVSTEQERGLGIGIVTEQRYELADTSKNPAVFEEHYVKVRYWHLQQIFVSEGQRVKAGELIGSVDNTGYSSGDHLHWEVKAVEFRNGQELYNVWQDNGYFGAVDPFAHMNTQLSAFELNDFFTRIRIQVFLLSLQIAEFLKGR